MPTQLKIIANTLTPYAPFTANFATPLIISPGNKITMDKFIAVIPDVTSNFALPESTFTLYIAIDALNYQSIQITIPSSTNTAVTTLLNLMTVLSNNQFSGYVINMLPVVNNLYNVYRDIGLKVQYSSVDSNFTFQYVTCPYSAQQLSAVNMAISPGAVGGYYPNVANSIWTLTQTNATNYLTRGGGCLLNFAFVRFPTQAEAASADGYFQAGLIANDGSFRGIGQETTGVYYLINNMGVKTTIADTWNPNAGNPYALDIYQADGFFQIRLYRSATQQTLYDSLISNSEALGPIDYTLGYTFSATGEVGVVQGQLPLFSANMLMTVDVPFQTPSLTAYSRTMGLNFDNAASLRSGLDLPGGLLICTPQQSSFGSYAGLTAINMALINSLFDIALEVIDLPLQTFQASSDGRPGSRKNVLAYFRPELSQVGSNTYRFDVNIFDWLDIAATYPLNLSSLSFRVFNPSTNTDLVMNSCSFNLLINTKEY